MKAYSKKTLILSREDVQEIVLYTGLDHMMDTMINRLESAMSDFDPIETQIPSRYGFHYDSPQSGLVEWMPLYQNGHKVMIKVVGYHPLNPHQFGLPTIVSTVSCYNTNTGHLSGILDGVFLTALRTGAASAIASKYLAKPDSKIFGMIGCGAQSITQLHALSRVFDFSRILIYDIDPKEMHSFNDRCEALNLHIKAEQSDIQTILSTAEILCTATSIDVGSGPLFSDMDTQPHLHINAVGSDFPGKVEIPKPLLLKSFVCPDFVKQAIIEGECQQLDRSDIGSSIIEVVKSPEKFEHLQYERSVFDSTGWALEDLVAMEILLELGGKLGVGKELEIESLSGDVRNPYDFVTQSIKLV
jgi:ornithine cyclodeaminase/alanine dehydrogenase-like protein (mu-crystallin family)